MKSLPPFLVTDDLLNELGTLAAPSMLAVALRAAVTGLGAVYPEGLTLFSYTAEFKQGARKGDEVMVALEETASAYPGDREFDVHFSKGEKFGGIGRWHLVFSQPASGHALPCDIRLVAADGRTDSELWRPEFTIATGQLIEDAQSLLWLAGQCARRYMKRLDAEFAAAIEPDDDLESRIYGGIAVASHQIRWPSSGEILRCALEYQLPLSSQQGRKMVFDGMLLAGGEAGTYLLGTFRFTVMRLNAQRSSIYPDGSKERI